MSLDKNNEQFWKQKLMAFLHDPPCKALDFGPTHEQDALNFCKSAGMVDDRDLGTFKAIKDADHYAAAADRFLFPQKECNSAFTGGVGETFKHPLSGEEYIIDSLLENGKAIEILQNAFGGIKTENPKHKFFLYWRRWLENTLAHSHDNSKARQLAFFPADTRLPDHTIWTHMSIASAFEGCRNPDTKVIDPAFMIFQVGPVQEFIAQARSTRDLWSGSYLLSWLTCAAIKAVTDECGPDSIIFPALKGLGIFDAMHREDIYENLMYGKDSLWKRMYKDGNEDEKKASAAQLLNPTVPNRFLALIPAHRMSELGRKAEAAVRKELATISESCWKRFSSLAKDAGELDNNVTNWKDRWDKQVDLFPQITWQTYKWDEKVLDAIQSDEKFDIAALQKAFKTLKDLYKLSQAVPEPLKDGRYFSDAEKRNLKNMAFAWPLYYAITDHAMASRRNTREFSCFKTDENQVGTVKDALSGKEEVIGSEGLWKKLKGTEFKDKEGPYGAISIIKRLWCYGDDCYLLKKLGIKYSLFKEAISFDSVESIAEGKPTTGNPYVAVIAMDGDDMGKWISGEKLPLLKEVLSSNAYNGIKKVTNFAELDKIKRGLSPSYHLQFSEALANFSNHIAGKIIAENKGQLIYAGGDDVLAMLPAENALKCAIALRAAFQGDISKIPHAEHSKYELALDEKKGFVKAGMSHSLIVPGPRADLSCGIAIAHKDHPLQHIVEEARKAESRAKKELHKSAFSFSLLKRGGETIHWGAKWDSKAVPLYDKFLNLRMDDEQGASSGNGKKLSGKFPYALAALLRPYNLSSGEFSDGFKPMELITVELAHVLKQQGQWAGSEDSDLAEFKKLSDGYLSELKATYEKNKDADIEEKRKFRKSAYDDFEKLFLAAAFIHRKRGEA